MTLKKKRKEKLTIRTIEKEVALTTGHTFKDTREIIDRFWQLLEQDIFETGKDVQITGYGRFYLMNNRPLSHAYKSKLKRKSKKKSYSIRFKTSKAHRIYLKSKYGDRDYSNIE